MDANDDIKNVHLGFSQFAFEISENEFFATNVPILFHKQFKKAHLKIISHEKSLRMILKYSISTGAFQTLLQNG